MLNHPRKSTPIEPGPHPPGGTARHVVLVSPDIPWNTGNTGRTCLAAGARLHLIKPLGFSLGCREVRRAGLDYWPQVNLSVWDDFASFHRALAPRDHELVLLTKNGRRSFWSMPRSPRLFLVLGSETRGLPADLLAVHRRQTYYIPMNDCIRSLNLSTAAAIALYESIRHGPCPHCQSEDAFTDSRLETPA